MTSNSNTQPELAMTLDFSGIITAVDVAVGFSDTSLNTWIGMPWKSTVDGSSQDKVARLLNTVRLERMTGYSEINQIMPDGSTHLLDFISVLTHDKEEKIIVLGRSLNSAVAAQQKMLEFQQSMERDLWKLREFENRYQALLSSPACAYVVFRDGDFKIVELNQLANEMLHMQIGDNALNTFNRSKNAVKLKQLVQSAKRYGKSPTALMCIGADDQRVSMYVVAVRTDDELNYLLQITPQWPAAVSDTQYRKEAATALEMLDALPLAIVAINAENTITYANGAFRALVGHASVANIPITGQSIDRWLLDSRQDLDMVRIIVPHDVDAKQFHGKLVVADDVTDVVVSTGEVQSKIPGTLILSCRRMV